MKSNFEGHNKRSSNNVHAYASVYGDSCLNGLNQISWHYAEVRSLLDSSGLCVLVTALSTRDFEGHTDHEAFIALLTSDPLSSAGVLQQHLRARQGQ